MEDLYFISKSTKTIFGLVKLGGKQQMDFLGIDYGHYSNKELAKSWYTETKRKIVGSKHPKLDEALEKLEILYKGMIQGGIKVNCKTFKKWVNVIPFPAGIKLVEAVEVIKKYIEMEAKNEKEIKRAQKEKRVCKTM